MDNVDNIDNTDSAVDIYMIKKNLNLTPEQRIVNHQGALDLALNLKKAGQKLNDKSKRAIKKTS